MNLIGLPHGFSVRPRASEPRFLAEVPPQVRLDPDSLPPPRMWSALRSPLFWKNVGLVGSGASVFGATFVWAAPAVVLAGEVGTKLAIGPFGSVGAQALMAGALGALGGAATVLIKNGIKAISGSIREARFHGSTMADELAKADAHYRKELWHEGRDTAKVGFLAGAGLSTAASFLPTYVLDLLVYTVIGARVFEGAKFVGNAIAFYLEQRRQGRAIDKNDAEAFKRHRWERDEEVEEMLLNAVNLGVLGMLAHSLEQIDGGDLAAINTGVAMSADEVAALANLPSEIAEIGGIVASEYREVGKAGGWARRLRDVFNGPGPTTDIETAEADNAVADRSA